MNHRALPAHLETYLGTIKGGWRRPHFTVVKFSKEISGGIPYMTLGLSDHPLESRTSGKIIRQELLMLVPKSVKGKAVGATLEWFGKNLLSKRSALLSGEVINATRPVIPKTDKLSLYATSPVYLPDEFAQYDDPAGPIVIAWLIPITKPEAAFVEEHGWSAFEQHLERTNPDLVDVRRPSSI
jgi:Suppressor of fused protein (SUFU)